MKSEQVLDYLRVTFISILSFILFSCNPYPQCEQSDKCFVIGENQRINLPVILPITSTNILLSQEFQTAVEFAFKENIWISKNTEISTIDNFDDPQKNNELILSFLESPESPVIFNFLFSQNHPQENKLIHKTEKILVTTDYVQVNDFKIDTFNPGKEVLINQSITLLSDFVYTNNLFVFSDFDTMQYDISNLCDQKNISCYQFNSTDSGLIQEISSQNSKPIALISNKPLILEWLRDNYSKIENPIMIIDSSFSNPADFQTQFNDLYWIGPDIWPDTNSDKKTFSEIPVEWNFIETILAYQQIKNVFQALELQLSNSKNGFRQIDSTLFIEQLTKNSTPKKITIHVYQLQDSQFIMVNEPAQE